MIHSSYYRPIVLPVLADCGKAEIDRCQDLSFTSTLNRVKIEEIGRDGIVDWKKGTPTVTGNMRQLEYGSLELYRKLANKSNAVNTIALTDYKTSVFDVAGFATDDDASFLGTLYYPNMRVSSIGLNIADPDALIERSFTFVGEDKKMLQGTNQYLIHKRSVLSGSGFNQTVTLSNPAPVADPDNSGQYLFKVVKITGGVASELTYGTQWSYNGAGTLTINENSLVGDVILSWYSAGSYISGEEPFVLNDADLAGISADSCSIFLESSNQLYRLQSVSVDTAFDRRDIKEIGNKNVVARGIRETTNTITLGRLLESYDIEEVLRGKAGTDYGVIDIRELGTKLNLIVKIYSDNTKTTFKLGYKWLELAPTGIDAGAPLNDYLTQGTTLEGEIGLITTQEGVL